MTLSLTTHHVDTHHTADVFPVECLPHPGLVVVVVVDSQRGVTTGQFISNPVHCRATHIRDINRGKLEIILLPNIWLWRSIQGVSSVNEMREGCNNVHKL